MTANPIIDAPGLRRALAGLAAAGLLSLALAGGAAAHEGHEGLNLGRGAAALGREEGAAAVP